MNVRLDERRGDQPARQVDGLGRGLGPGRELGARGGLAARGGRAAGGDDPAAGDGEVGEGVLARQAGVAQQQIDHAAIMPGQPGGRDAPVRDLQEVSIEK